MKLKLLWHNSTLRLCVVVGVVILTVLALLITMVIQPFVTSIPSSPPAVDERRLKAHVKYLSVDLYPRSFEQIGNMNRAANYIKHHFEHSGGQVTVQHFSVGGTDYQNIIARYGDSNGPVLIVGAHYDAHGDTQQGAQFPAGYDLTTHTPGADDNASGVAGLLELARLLGKSKPAQPVELVAYALEEPPYFRTEDMGSARHVQSIQATHQPVRLMLSLEMIGYFSDAPGSQQFPLPGLAQLYPDRGNFIAVVGKLSDFGATRAVKAAMSGATSLPVYSINAPRLVPGIDFSDHQNYWDKGIPALMITDTAFMRNRNYHRAGDTYDKLDYQRMVQVVQGVYAYTQHP